MASITSRSPSLEPVTDGDELTTLVETVFSDPGARRGMGWTEDDDPEEAMEAISGLWAKRFERGWRIYDVRREGQRVGLAALGPPEEPEPWWAVYLLERGEGLGKAIGRRLVERARRDGADALLAVTWVKNAASRGMLEALGFEQQGPAPYDWAEESELAWLAYRRELAPSGRLN